MFNPVRMAVAVATLSGFVAFADRSEAVTFGFAQITSNGNPAVGAQLSVDVTDAGGGTVQFFFENSGPIASSITDIYFDDPTLFGPDPPGPTPPAPVPGTALFTGVSSIVESPGVAYSQSADPGNLPGANNAIPDFETTLGLSADSDAPVSANGVNPLESVSIYLALATGKTFANVLGAMADLSLRIGLHVQSIGAPGGSESFVNSVPIPASLLLFASALAGLGFLGKLRRRARIAA